MKLKYRFQPLFVFALSILFLAACQETQPALPPPTTVPSAVPTSAAATPSPTSIATETSIPEGTDTTPMPTPEMALTNIPPLDTVILWPDLSAFTLFPDEFNFRIQNGELVGEDMRQGRYWTSSGWNLPGAFYTEEDMVYVSGYLQCTRFEQPVSCAYEPFRWQVGGGDQNGILGTPGFRWSLDLCTLLEDEELTLHFNCAQPADRGFGKIYDTVWLGAFSGQGGQLHDVHVSFFGIDWSGVIPTPTPQAAH